MDFRAGLDAVAMRKNPYFCLESTPGHQTPSLVTVESHSRHNLVSVQIDAIQPLL